MSAAILGGSGSLRQGIVRHVVVRFELPDGLHIYGEPVPDGVVATTVAVSGPAGLVTEAPITPPTEPLTLEQWEALKSERGGRSTGCTWGSQHSRRRRPR